MVPDLPPFTWFGNTTIEDLSALYDLVELKADAVMATMEEIREANSGLRERQTYFEEENQNYEAKIEELKDLVAELRNQE